MPASSETILSVTAHPGDSTSETVLGEKFKGDGYYGRSDGLHTVQINVDGVSGTIKMQGTLAVDPVEADAHVRTPWVEFKGLRQCADSPF